ncbi:MAG: BatA domain-containing protein, partial [Rhodospirillales bacterium]|nr:BatA domain-containing protein [Rhodospirillales bacterium]
MIFAAPALLSALALLPALWWLLRLTPPPPRRQVFPAIGLLVGLSAPERTPARAPWWVLALRLAAAALLIVGLAGPILHPGTALPGRGPVLLAIDNGWAAAPGWEARRAAANAVLDRAARAGRKVALLPTADDPAGTAPRLGPALPAAAQRPRLAALRPEP